MCPGIDRTWNGSLPCSMYRRLLLGGWSAGGLRAILSVSIPSVSSWIAGGLRAAEPTASQEPLHLCCQEPRLFPLQCGVFCEHLVYASSLPASALAPVDFTAKFSAAHYVEHLRATVNLSNQSSRFLGLSPANQARHNVGRLMGLSPIVKPPPSACFSLNRPMGLRPPPP
jgi:hypothetical protein